MYCYGYTFPFRVFCKNSVSTWKPIEKDFDGVSFTAYAPFISDFSTRRSCPSFEYGKSPALIQRGIQTDRRDLGLVALPTFKFNDKGETGVLIAWTENPDLSDVDHLPCSAIQIDIDAKSEELASKIASHLHRTWMRETRRLTRQYWIGFFPTYFESFLRTAFKVGEDYQLQDEPFTHAQFTSSDPSTLLLDEELWEQSWNNLIDEPFPSSLDHLLDGRHLAATGEKYKSILSLATSIERTKYTIWEHLFRRGLCDRNDHKNAMNDTSKPERYFSELLEKRVGRNLAKENSDLSLLIETIWIIRGKIAHGREDEIPQKFRWIMEENNILQRSEDLFSMLSFTSEVLST